MATGILDGHADLTAADVCRRKLDAVPVFEMMREAPALPLLQADTI